MLLWGVWPLALLVCIGPDGWTSARAKSSRFFSNERPKRESGGAPDPAVVQAEKKVISDLRFESKAFIPRTDGAAGSTSNSVQGTSVPSKVSAVFRVARTTRGKDLSQKDGRL